MFLSLVGALVFLTAIGMNVQISDLGSSFDMNTVTVTDIVIFS